jgi:hypothetical protein
LEKVLAPDFRRRILGSGERQRREGEQEGNDPTGNRKRQAQHGSHVGAAFITFYDDYKVKLTITLPKGDLGRAGSLSLRQLLPPAR